VITDKSINGLKCEAKPRYTSIRNVRLQHDDG